MNTEEIVFDENYEKTMAKLTASAERPDFSLETVKNELNALYIYEGQDWAGRGELKQSEIAGAILAYQVFLNKIQSE